MMRIIGLGCLAGLWILMGCASTNTSNTSRTAQEQLLISNSMDQALNKVDFSAFNGSRVFIDEKYLDCVDKQYLVGSVRHRTLRSGARVVEKAEEADIIVEVRSGGVGTNITDSYIGSPKIAISDSLAALHPGNSFDEQATANGNRENRDRGIQCQDPPTLRRRRDDDGPIGR